MSGCIGRIRRRNMRKLRPTLIFDGDCGICRTWVDYWAQLTATRRLPPLPGGGERFPANPASRVQRAMQLIVPDGTVYAGAAATFRLLTYAPARSWWWWLYRYLPGFAPLSEAAYSFLSQRRELLGPRYTPPLGSHARAGVLRARHLAVPARARRNLRRGLRLARRADPRPRRARRHLAARPLPPCRARSLGHCRLLAPAHAVLDGP